VSKRAGILGRILGRFGYHKGGPPAPPRSRRVFAIRVPERMRGRSGIDAAADSRHHENHWANASDQDASALLEGNLATVRKRAIYELSNNGYAAGIAGTLANWVVGTGPRLQMESDDSGFGDRVEDAFGEWATSTYCDVERKLTLADMIDLGVRQLCTCGEMAIVEESDPDSPLPVQYCLHFIEPHRLDDPLGLLGADGVQNGIKRDERGRPLEYYVAKVHPGSSLNLAKIGDYTVVPAERMIHVFRLDRAGQDRGWPWLMPSLPVFASLRRWTLACIRAAETAADVAMFMQTTSEQIEHEAAESADVFDIEMASMVTLPAGWTASQMKAEHPPSMYGDVKRELIGEAARPIHMPLNIALANSQDYNYASGRLDHQSFFRFVRYVEWWLSIHVCNRVFASWLNEAIRIPGYLGRASGRLGRPAVRMLTAEKAAAEKGVLPRARVTYGRAPRDGRPQDVATWYWPGFKHVDPQKEANAQETRLGDGTANLIDEMAEEGKDWDRHLVKRARVAKRVRELAEEYGVPPEEILRLVPKGAKPKTEKDDDEDTDDDDES